MKKLCYRIPGAHVARIAPAGAIPPATKKTSCKRTFMPEKGQKNPRAVTRTGKENYLPSFAAITSAAFLPQTRQLL